MVGRIGGRRFAGAGGARVSAVYTCTCVARACESGGGLIGRWRHDGGSGKRGHVRPLSNGHPSPDPPYPPSASSFPRVTYLPPPPRSSFPLSLFFSATIPGRLASSHPPFPVYPRTTIAHRHHSGTTTTTTTTPLTLIHTALNYGAYIGTYRYVHLYVHGHGVYTRAALVYPPLSYTTVSQNELDISRAREKSLNTRYTVYAITDAPPNFGALSERRHVTRAPLGETIGRFVSFRFGSGLAARALRQFFV